MGVFVEEIIGIYYKNKEPNQLKFRKVETLNYPRLAFEF